MLALRGPLSSGFRLLNELGYEGAELMVRDVQHLNPDEIKLLAAEYKLALPAVSTGQMRKEDGLQLCAIDEAARRHAVSRTKEVIEFAAALQSPQINISTLRGHLPAGAAERGAALQAARARVGELLDAASACGGRRAPSAPAACRSILLKQTRRGQFVWPAASARRRARRAAVSCCHCSAC